MTTKPLLRWATLVAVTALVALAVVVTVPPWRGRIPCIVQTKIGSWTGIYFHRFPSDFTGVCRLWDDHGRLLFEHPYTNGLRDGKWFSYGRDGSTVSQGEYRAGEPWEGICFIYDEKAWIGEYRQGRPWKGCLPVPQSDSAEWRHFIDGEEVTEFEYKSQNDIAKDSRCVGLHSIKASADIR
jgi:hypothetical protein